VPLVVSDPGSASAIELRRAARIMAGQVSIQSLSSLPVL
jgi:hypothetical protein